MPAGMRAADRDVRPPRVKIGTMGLRKALCCAITWLLAGAGNAVLYAAPFKGQATGTQKSATSGATKKTTSKKARSQSKRSRSSWRTIQKAPTKERYQEIQQALIHYGYFSGPSTGEWGADSVEALTRFQRDQQLEPTGKINSLSLIALGLGPKRSAGPRSNSPPAPTGDSNDNRSAERDQRP